MHQADDDPDRLKAEVARLAAALAASEARHARAQADAQHRVRNLLSVLRSISSRSLESAVSLEELAMHQSGRISAIARVEEALGLSASEGADLEHLLWNEWSAVLSSAEEWRGEASGPPVSLAPRAAERLGLTFHELTTNALKFGALAATQGRIRVVWRLSGGSLDIDWEESGVPLVDSAPTREGCGRDLIERGLPYDLKAETSLRFSPGGVRCRISLPLRGNVILRDPVAFPPSEHP